MAKSSIPALPADRLQLKSKLLAERLYEKRKVKIEAVGGKPYLGEQLTKDQRLAQYGQMRRDPDAWAQIIAQVGRPKEDGRLLIPKKLLEEVTKFEGELRNGTL